MKIERGYAEYSDKAIKRDAVKQEKPTAPQTEKTVDVQLSETAQAIQKSANQTASRSERVAELKRAIKEGTYQVSAETIADKMLHQDEKQVNKMTQRESERQLQQFLRLLQKEKTCLIKNQAEKLPELVEKKTAFVPVFSMYEGTLSAAIKELIRQIQVQQAENLLLTEQAISFQTVLMDAVKENIKTPANTYSKYQEKQAVSTAIIDQKM